MKILLTGASGQLGREWQQAVHGDENIILWPYTSSQLDITNEKQVESELQRRQPEVVVNCAAYTDVDGAEEHREQAYQVNAEAVETLARYCDDIGSKLIHYSTDYVFAGRRQDREQCPDGYPEDYHTDPINSYGQTKWEGEQAIRKATDDHLILRLSWLCGQFGGNFVKTMLKLGRERDELQVVDDQWGSPTFTGNTVTNSLQLLKTGARGTYHITTKGMITWYDFARSIFTFSGIDVELEAVSSDVFPAKATRPHFSKLSTKKLESVHGTNVISWENGLKVLLNQLAEKR